MAARTQAEEQLQKAAYQYFRYQYPQYLFNFDMGGVRLPIGLAKKCKLMGHKKDYPDIFIPEPKKKFCGLFIELKTAGLKLKNNKGNWARQHFKDQALMLEQLTQRGYKAVFAVGFEEYQKILDDYLTDL